MYNVEEFKNLYPEMFAQTSPTDIIIGVLILASLFIIPYLYIKFLEDRVTSFMGNRLIPFIEFRLRLKRIIDILHRILEIPVFSDPRSRI
ncbi:MAG: hypothetical protein OIN87_13935 [Candidatus Methanoperedens sp.]|nr:hypothetical protein [Candidatus Methanoperedens sp.]